MSCIWREASDLFDQRCYLRMLKSRYHEYSASEQAQNIFSLMQHLLKLWISQGSRHHVTPSLLRWQEESSLTLPAHTGARADGFAKYGTAELLGKFISGIKIFPGCEAALLPGCSILILEGGVNRHYVLCNLVWVVDESTEVFSNMYEEKSAAQRTPLFLAIFVSPAKAAPAFDLIKPKLFTRCLVAHFKVMVVSSLQWGQVYGMQPLLCQCSQASQFCVLLCFTGHLTRLRNNITASKSSLGNSLCT